MTPTESDAAPRTPATVAEDLAKTIRLLASTGRRLFIRHLYEPLDFHGWKRRPTNETVRRLMEHIDRVVVQSAAVHTAGPLARRLISAAMNDTLSAVGDASIFFLERMQRHARVAAAPEAAEFLHAVQKPLNEFRDLHQQRSEQLFSAGLESLTTQDLREAFAPVQLGRTREKVELQRQALNLFQKIVIASKNEDFDRCRKLIARYLIQYGDQETNNREEVDRLIDALGRRSAGFRKSLEDGIAINLFYDIQHSIVASDLRLTIRGIRKYAHIFQGEPAVRYFHEIDALEQRLYDLITRKDMWKELKNS